jgi:drug/metabolite transporter (DMT)-like permease
MKEGLKGFGPIELASLRVLIAGTLLWPLALRYIFLNKKQPWLYLITAGVTATAGPAVLFAIAQTRIDSSTSGILNSGTPIFTFLIGLLFFQQTFSLRKLTGLLLGLSGACLIVLMQAGGKLNPAFGYASLALVATIIYGLNANFVRQHLGHISPLSVTALSLGIWAIPAWLFVLFFSEIPIKLESSSQAQTSLLYIFILAGVGTALAQGLFYKLLQQTSALFATSISYTIPLVAVLFGVLDGEKIGFLHGIGGLAILIGIYLISKQPNNLAAKLSN